MGRGTAKLSIIGAMGVLLVVAFAAATLAIARETTQGQLNVAVLAGHAQATERDRVLSGAFDAEFAPHTDHTIELRGSETRQWLRLRFDASRLEKDHGVPRVWRLVLSRVAMQQVTLHVPKPDGGWQSTTDSFYAPANDAGLLSSAYAFELPATLAGTVTLYLEVESDWLVRLDPQLVAEKDFLAADRAHSVLFSALYASVLVMVLSNLALFFALRDRCYLSYVGFLSSLLLTALVVSGHGYGLPLIEGLGVLGGFGAYALANAANGAAVGFFRRFTDSARYLPRIDKFLGYATLMLFGLAALCLFGWPFPLVGLRSVSNLMFLLVIVALAVLALRIWRLGSRAAGIYLVIWTPYGAMVVMRVLVAQGLLPATTFTLYGFQLAAAVLALLFSIALADRVLEFRLQRDRIRELKDQAEADLGTEKRRRDFAEQLKSLLLQSAVVDAEWVAYTRLLQSLAPLLPQRAAAILLRPEHGHEALLVEPGDARPRMAAFVAAHASALRGVQRSHGPLVLPGELAVFGDSASPRPVAGHGDIAVVPLDPDQHGTGILLVERAAGASFRPNELTLAGDFCALTQSAVKEIHAREQLKRQAEHDPLTGVFNRRSGDAKLDEAMKKSSEGRRPLSVLFLDLDHFKQVNDRHGHAAGDQCLRAAAECIRQCLAPGQAVARYGGEEFLAILPGVALEEARQLGERLRSTLELRPISCAAGRIQLTASVGITERLPDDYSPLSLLERADRALYAAKRGGRNRVVTSADKMQATALPETGDQYDL